MCFWATSEGIIKLGYREQQKNESYVRNLIFLGLQTRKWFNFQMLLTK